VTFLGMATGDVLGTLAVGGDPQPGAVVRDGMLYVPLQRLEKDAKHPHGVLRAIDLTTRTISWEFAATARASRLAGCTEGVAFPASDNSVVVFR
jgi:hypothetical protein